MKPRSSTLRIRLAGLCLVAMFATFLPAAAAFWDTAVPTADVASNRAPSAQAVEGQTFTGVMIELPLTATDPDGDSVLLKLVDLPRLGTASINEDKLQYTPQEGKTGTDKFTYLAMDTFGNQSNRRKSKSNHQKQSQTDLFRYGAKRFPLCRSATGRSRGDDR